MMQYLTPHPKKPQPWLMTKDWPEFWRVRLPNKDQLDEKTEWCRKTFDPQDWGKSFGSEVFYFSSKDAATMFILRWMGDK